MCFHFFVCVPSWVSEGMKVVDMFKVAPEGSEFQCETCQLWKSLKSDSSRDPEKKKNSVRIHELEPLIHPVDFNSECEIYMEWKYS